MHDTDHEDKVDASPVVAHPATDPDLPVSTAVRFLEHPAGILLLGDASDPSVGAVAGDVRDDTVDRLDALLVSLVSLADLDNALADVGDHTSQVSEWVREVRRAR